MSPLPSSVRAAVARAARASEVIEIVASSGRRPLAPRDDKKLPAFFKGNFIGKITAMTSIP
eukprot:29006-Pelagococcus_subviridis.AAC.13